MATTKSAAPRLAPQDRVTDEWLGPHLPGVFARGHRYNAELLRSSAEAIIAAAGIAPGMAVVDIAAGSGIPALTIAERVRPGGRVSAVDPSPVMLEALARNVRAAGLDNVDLVPASVTAMPFPPASFDAATCHLGAMFFPDLPAALIAIRRVLRPGARAAFVGWGDLADNTLFGRRFAIHARHLGPRPAPADPAEELWPMRFALPGTLAAAIERAGFADVREEQPVLPMTWPGPPETLAGFWEEMASLGGDVSAATRAALAADTLAALRQVAQPDGLHFRARFIVASGRAPA